MLLVSHAGRWMPSAKIGIFFHINKIHTLQKTGVSYHLVLTPVPLGLGFDSLVLLLFGSVLDHVDVGVTSAVLELYGTVNQSIQRVILAHANILAGTMLGTALTADDVTGLGKLTTKNLDAEAFAFALAAVL